MDNTISLSNLIECYNNRELMLGFKSVSGLIGNLSIIIEFEKCYFCINTETNICSVYERFNRYCIDLVEVDLDNRENINLIERYQNVHIDLLQIGRASCRERV